MNKVFEGAFGEEIVTEEGFLFLRDKDVVSGSGSMGCGFSYDYRSSTEHS